MIIPLSEVLLWKLVVVKPVKNSARFNGIQRFIAVFTKAQN
jgi:hypothetical protein